MEVGSLRPGRGALMGAGTGRVRPAGLSRFRGLPASTADQALGRRDLPARLPLPRFGLASRGGEKAESRVASSFSLSSPLLKFLYLRRPGVRPIHTSALKLGAAVRAEPGLPRGLSRRRKEALRAQGQCPVRAERARCWPRHLCGRTEAAPSPRPGAPRATKMA